ncbi:MAG: hypothetical protein AAGF71_08355 [Pseudomonadota bacterium]
MKFEWDPTKAQANLVKHAVSFDLLVRMDWLSVLSIEDQRRD